jgi:hypothetical protein
MQRVKGPQGSTITPARAQARPLRLPVGGFALSTLAAYAEEYWGDDAPEIEAVTAALRAGGGSALVFDAADAERVADGLTALSNTEDGEAEGEARLPKDQRDPERARVLRAAATGLSTLSGKARRLGVQHAAKAANVGGDA